MKRVPGRLARDPRGATAIEYGLIVCLIALALIGSMTLFGSSSNGAWGNFVAKVGAKLPTT